MSLCVFLSTTTTTTTTTTTSLRESLAQGLGLVDQLNNIIGASYYNETAASSTINKCLSCKRYIVSLAALASSFVCV